MFQLRYLHTLNVISAEKNSTIVFPIPVDIISHLMQSKSWQTKKKLMFGATLSEECHMHIRHLYKLIFIFKFYLDGSSVLL